MVNFELEGGFIKQTTINIRSLTYIPEILMPTSERTDEMDFDTATVIQLLIDGVINNDKTKANSKRR
jgi:hypothetical protein